MFNLHTQNITIAVSPSTYKLDKQKALASSKLSKRVKISALMMKPFPLVLKKLLMKLKHHSLLSHFQSLTDLSHLEHINQNLPQMNQLIY